MKAKIIFAALLLLLCLLLLCGCGKEKQATSIDDLSGKRIGVMTGSIYDEAAKANIRNAQLVYYDSVSELPTALDAGEIDAYIVDEPIMRVLLASHPRERYLAVLEPVRYGVAFPKDGEGAALCDQFCVFLKKISTNGTLRQLNDLWFGTDEAQQVVDYESLIGTNGTLRLATCSDLVPFAYRNKDGSLVGYELDIITRFCRENGYALDIEDLSFADALDAVRKGSCDLAAMGISITEDRKQSMVFSDSDYIGGVVVVVPSNSAAAETTETEQTIRSLSDLSGKRVGTLTGSMLGDTLTQYVKDAHIEYYNSFADCCLALETGKLDAYVTDKPLAYKGMKQYPAHKILTQLREDDYAFVFNGENRELCTQMNDFLAKLREDGTLEELQAVWFGTDVGKQVVDYDSLTGENGTLKFATTLATGEPFAYIREGEEFIGYEIDLAVRFCREYGYDIEIEDFDIPTMLGMVREGRFDFGGGCMTVTEERIQSGLLFSDADFNGGVVVIVKDDTVPTVYSSLDDLKGKKIAVLRGTYLDTLVPEFVDEPQMEYCGSNAEISMALEMGMADAYVTDEPIARILMRDYPSHQILAQLQNNDYAFVFGSSQEKLRDQMNEFLGKLRADGTLEELRMLWLSADTEKQVVDLSDLPATNGTLKFACSTATGEPFAYMRDGEIVGYEIDLAVRFCREYGYGIEIEDYSFRSLLAALSSGKCDFGASCVTVTEERIQSGYLFSDADYEGGVVIVVKGNDAAAQSPVSVFADLAKLNGKRIAMLSGSVFDTVVPQFIEDPQFEYYNSFSDAAQALDNGKVDAYVMDDAPARLVMRDYPSQRILRQITNEEYAFIFGNSAKGEKALVQFNEFIRRLKADGTLKEIEGVWLGAVEEKKVVDYSGLPDTNGTLRFVTCTGTGAPFSYVKDGQLVGYDLDLAVRFCREYGYGLKVEDMNVAGMLTALNAGKCDFGGAGVTITEERKQSGLKFAEPNHDGGAVVVVNSGTKANTAASGLTDAASDGLRESFEKTFIREERWKLFVGGVGVTLLITVLSVVFGTVGGFLLYLVYRRRNRVFNGVLDFIAGLQEKTPVVVILMILYYVVFSSSELNGIWVSIIGFSVMFALSFVGTVDAGVNEVDRGQTEASLALGFTSMRSFLLVTLPQAARLFLPNYKSSIVSLLKDTAVVGYIAVQDLTKVGDIVRSRTYEAFFPLIATALIYIVLAWLLTLPVARVEEDVDPKLRKPEKILRDIRTGKTDK